MRAHEKKNPAGTGGRRVEVLVVDDNPAMCDEYLELLTALGYVCSSATNGAEALMAIVASPNIGIVLTDLLMPGTDGMALLSDLQVRFSPHRPIVSIVVTGFPTLETAVEVMRVQALDFLVKPVSPRDLANALRRATAHWNVLDKQFRLLSLLEDAGTAEGGATEASNSKPNLVIPSREVLHKFARSMLKARQQRSDFLDTSKFADPAWDIMLDLTAAALEGRSVPAISVSAAACVPLSTGLRHLKRLVEDGVIRRWDDPDDKRRSLLALEDPALEAMLKYLSSVWLNMSAEVASGSRA